MKTIVPYFKVILPWCPMLGKEVIYFFLGQVADVDIKCYEMTFLRKSEDDGKILAIPSKEDKHWV
jgi:hypothetical protein